jgi:hypothetical protein
MVGEIRAFHVKCKYTNALICTCAQGQPRSWLHCPRNREEFGAKAEELWKLYYSAREDQASGEPVASTSTRSEVRSEPFIFQGMTREIALPPLPPRFPLTEAKQARGWSFGELRDKLGDEKAMTLADSSFSARQWKHLSLIHGAPASVQTNDTDAYAAVVGGARFKLEAAKRVLRDKLESVKWLEEKAANIEQDAEEFKQSVERELMDEQRQQDLGVAEVGVVEGTTPQKEQKEKKREDGKEKDGHVAVEDSAGKKHSSENTKTKKKRKRTLAVPRKRKRSKRVPRVDFKFDILEIIDEENEEGEEEARPGSTSPATPEPAPAAPEEAQQKETNFGGKALVSERLQLKHLQSEK